MKTLLFRFSAWRARKNAKLKAKSTRAEQADSGIGAEAPIRKASEDRLRRAGFADRIAGVLSELSLREGRVFSIRGGWGFGKSSLKNLITERLDAREDGADWLDFNPWQWGDGDAIARALFGQIADRLGGEHSKSALKRAEALRRYGAILTGASTPLKNAGGSTHIISTVLTNASVIAVASAIGFQLPTVAKVAAALAILAGATPMIGRVLSHFGHDHSADPLDKVRTALETRLRELDRPLVVFVDDIDRLEPEQIRVLLRQVKANANLPNIAFVLLFQASIVERALDPVADNDGRAFLEKVVQANFDLPAVPVSVVHTMFGTDLSELAGVYATETNGFTQTYWGNALVGCIHPRLRNMRDARRLISSIAVHMPLHVDGDVFEVNIVDFLLLESLRVFEPDFYGALCREKELVLQARRYRGDRREDSQRAAIVQLLTIVPEARRTLAQDTLTQLFPQLAWAFGGSHYDSGFRKTWLAEKRVCSERYFPRYFELQTAEGEISERRFVEFIDATDTKQNVSLAIAGIEADGLLPSLVARFDESVDRLPVENAGVVLPAMFSVADKLVGTREFDPFSSPWVSAWRATSWFLKNIPEDLRGDLALDALRETHALSVAAMIIHLSDPNDQDDGGRHAFEPTLSVETVAAMKAEWLQQMRNRAANDEALIVEPDLTSLLYRWGSYAGSMDEPRAWVAETINTSEGFAQMATRMMSRGSSHAVGDRVSTPRNSFNRETVDDLIGVDVAKTRCDEINPTDFPEHEVALQTLGRSLDTWLGIRTRAPFEL